MSENDLIYDWNLAGHVPIPSGTQVLVNDETLRDGLQNPSIHDPTIEDKVELLHLMEVLAIDSANIGLPGAGPRAFKDVETLALEIAGHHMHIKPNCAARTVEADIRPIVEISQRVGIPIEAATFLGSSPIRRLVEDWSVDHLERTTEKAVKFAVEHGLPSMYVTEDTVRTDPETVKRLYTTAIRSGARAIVLCDTVGHATPEGAYNLVKFVIDEVVKPSGEEYPSRLARASRPRFGDCQLLSGDCCGRTANSRGRLIVGRTRRQYPDGTVADQFAPYGSTA